MSESETPFPGRRKRIDHKQEDSVSSNENNNNNVLRDICNQNIRAGGQGPFACKRIG